jgi:hypothetical protein
MKVDHTMVRFVTGVAFAEGGLWSQAGVATISPSIFSSGKSSIDNSHDIVADGCMCACPYSFSGLLWQRRRVEGRRKRDHRHGCWQCRDRCCPSSASAAFALKPTRRATLTTCPMHRRDLRAEWNVGANRPGHHHNRRKLGGRQIHDLLDQLRVESERIADIELDGHCWGVSVRR